MSNLGDSLVHLEKNINFLKVLLRLKAQKQFCSAFEVDFYSTRMYLKKYKRKHTFETCIKEFNPYTFVANMV